MLIGFLDFSQTSGKYDYIKIFFAECDHRKHAQIIADSDRISAVSATTPGMQLRVWS